ncbi:MAG: hypothetical protein KJ062_14570 [Thermoanaerobaculia bacterium]|nr:hypothetical protein [Thermoanaerobaculia bacterium]
MTDHSRPQHEPAEFDSEIHVRAIFFAIAGLALVIALSFLGVIAFSKVLKARAVERDPAPLPVAEANQPRPRPRAALQADPTADMVKFAKEEDAALATWAWVDRENGVVQIPVDRALEIVAERGLPVPPPMPEVVAVPEATP